MRQNGYHVSWYPFFASIADRISRSAANCILKTAVRCGILEKMHDAADRNLDEVIGMHEECLLCKASLEYLDSDVRMECQLCHKIAETKTRCVNHHFVCDACHTQGVDQIFSLCLHETSGNPAAILEKMMSLKTCHMHGPEHHIMVGAALLTAYHNIVGAIDLQDALCEMLKRGKQVPGGACGFWGACGAGISTGMFVSIALKATPLSKDAWGLSNQMTARALDAIGKHGGPRCCKRDSYLAMMEAVRFTAEKMGVSMELGSIVCSRSHLNSQCLQAECPFYPQQKKKVAFLCVHNSCRSQIAEALGKHLADDVFESFSSGTETKPNINPDAVRLMKQLYGIDMEAAQYSKTYDKIPVPDIAISMGCDVGCPYIGRAFDDNWNLEDPTGKSEEEFIRIIREIETRILQLRDRLLKMEAACMS